MSDDLSLSPAEAAEQAFLDATGYTFNGIALEPWSYGRRAAAQRLGLRYGLVDDLREIELSLPVAGRKKKREKIVTYDYPGLWDDIVTVLFLMTLPAERIARTRGAAAVAEFREDAEAWAQAQRLDPERRGTFWEAFALFNRIMQDAEATDVQTTERAELGKE